MLYFIWICFSPCELSSKLHYQSNLPRFTLLKILTHILIYVSGFVCSLWRWLGTVLGKWIGNVPSISISYVIQHFLSQWQSAGISLNRTKLIRPNWDSHVTIAFKVIVSVTSIDNTTQRFVLIFTLHGVVGLKLDFGVIIGKLSK